ncbi:MAG: xanthine dehydrogenase small subunit [Granulosicoccus sp.]
MIRFLYEQTLIELRDVSADLTVLDWLRLHRNRTGTKEGCGSGDCGACTVVVASPNLSDNPESALSYESINSCITFVGALHAKQLLSVESLAEAGKLHPVQQAMVEEHGSQCGFCTPGFVMSLYALYERDEDEAVLAKEVDRALGGNLCRCTGYRPIKQAASRALSMRSSQPLSEEQRVLRTHTAERLIELQARTPEPANADSGFYQPDRLEQLANLIKQYPHARLLAGGTDLALEVTQQMKTLPLLISMNGVPELQEVNKTSSDITLGAAVTLSRCVSILQDRIPGSHELLMRFGSDQVRNQATIGGNIGSASPIGDLPPLLIALDAILIVQRGDTLRELTLESHFTGYRQTTLKPGEFIRAVRIPLPDPAHVFAVHKISKRKEDDISSVCMAIHLPMLDKCVHDARIAFGGMAATPVRAKQAEQALNGKPFSDASVKLAQQALAEELSPITDARATAGYRMQVAQNLLQRVLLDRDGI